jgi:hypothetical protein
MLSRWASEANLVGSSVVVRQKKSRHVAVGFRDDPDASLVGEPISGQNSEALLQTQLVLANIVGVQVAWIETDVFNEKSQGVIAAGLECCCRSRCHHDLTERE